ncbi:murein DD-endopeptidase MepM [Pedobacter glucosidilyticus]|nr:murein DD-endopeptidase MepM [Pedobacter glucosidilyticus]
MASCKSIFKTSPYNEYLNSLESAGLSNSKMAVLWKEKGAKAITSPTQEIKSPHQEEIFFRDHTPQALGYKINYKKGRKYIFSIKTAEEANFKIFIDVFESDKQLHHYWGLNSADTTLVYENQEDKTLILRLQPELLITGKVNLKIIDEPKLGFPVSNAGNKNIQSFWGMDRDGGSRKHEGIDIFAKKGTPILAVDKGAITRVQETTIGGKVIWQRLGVFSQSIYYAHLDSQLVKVGQTVHKGDTIGLIGNTGNAMGTSPHLHFGIYTSSGAIDPLDYVLLNNTAVPALKKEIKYLGEEIIIKKNNKIIPIKVLAVSNAAIVYENELGIIENASNVNLERVNHQPKYKTEKYLYAKPLPNDMEVGILNPKEKFTVLGKTDGFFYIQQNGIKGWVSIN